MGKSHKVFYGNICFVCHLSIKERELKKCSTCKIIQYCCKAHQKIHWKDHRSLCRVIHKVEFMLKPKSSNSNINWYKHRTSLLMLCELKMKRKLKPYEINMILFPNNCQICHKKSDLQPCLNCLCVDYCSINHKQADLASHKDLCHQFSLCLKLDLYLEKTHFYPDYMLWEGNCSLLDSVDNFIKNNIKIKKSVELTKLEERALVSELITCPLSLLFGLAQINYEFKENTIVHVVGCNFLETASPKSWETILHINSTIQNLKVYFIGPEVQKNCNIELCIHCKNRLTFRYSKDFYHDYLQRTGYQDPDLICSFNCGFHEFEDSSMDTWDRTLPLLIRNKKVPLIFTSFTKEEAEKDSQLLSKKNESISVKISKNKFGSLRPYRDLENSGVYFNNNYIGVVSSSF